VGLTGVQADADPAGANTEIQFNDNGTMSASSDLTWDGSAFRVTGALELTGSATSLITLHTRDDDSLKEIAFLKDGVAAAAIQINSAEHLFIENENPKDIILRANNQNVLRVVGSERRVIVGNVSRTTANAELDVEGNAVISGTLDVTSQLSASTLVGDGSGLVNLPVSNPFPFTGEAQITGTLTTISGSTQVFEVDTSEAGKGAVRGRMVQQIFSSFALTSGAQARIGRYISIGSNAGTVSNNLSDTNVIISAFSGRLVSITYHMSSIPDRQNPALGSPKFELLVGDVNTLKGQTFDDAVSVVAQATASSWPGHRVVGGINVLNGEGTLGGTNTTGSWAFGTGSVVGLRFYSGDASGYNYPGNSTITTVWEFDQLNPYISGSGN
jgi:hypothetical protein